MVSAARTSPRASAWLANAPIDLAMAFGWLPFYDGLIWKMRRREVRTPIVASSVKRGNV